MAIDKNILYFFIVQLTVVPISPHPSLSLHSPEPPTFNPTCCWLWMCPLYMFLDDTFLYFPYYPSAPSPHIILKFIYYQCHVFMCCWFLFVLHKWYTWFNSPFFLSKSFICGHYILLLFVWCVVFWFLWMYVCMYICEYMCGYRFYTHWFCLYIKDVHFLTKVTFPNLLEKSSMLF